jgi:hypothetical protein
VCATSLGLQVLCDGCDKGFHWWCLKLQGIPEGDWYCSGCRPATDASIPAEQAAPQPTATAAVEAVGASTQPTPSGKARCEGLSAKGEQCKLTTSTGEVLCWHHLQQQSKASASGQPSAPQPEQPEPTASEAEEPAPRPTAAVAAEASAPGQPSAPPAEAEQPASEPTGAAAVDAVGSISAAEPAAATPACAPKKKAGRVSKEELARRAALKAQGEAEEARPVTSANHPMRRSAPVKRFDPTPTSEHPRARPTPPPPTASSSTPRADPKQALAGKAHPDEELTASEAEGAEAADSKAEQPAAEDEQTASGKALCEFFSVDNPAGAPCKHAASAGEVLCWQHVKHKASVPQFAAPQPAAEQAEPPASEAQLPIPPPPPAEGAVDTFAFKRRIPVKSKCAGFNQKREPCKFYALPGESFCKKDLQAMKAKASEQSSDAEKAEAAVSDAGQPAPTLPLAGQPAPTLPLAGQPTGKGRKCQGHNTKGEPCTRYALDDEVFCRKDLELFNAKASAQPSAPPSQAAQPEPTASETEQAAPQPAAAAAVEASASGQPSAPPSEPEYSEATGSEAEQPEPTPSEAGQAAAEAEQPEPTVSEAEQPIPPPPPAEEAVGASNQQTASGKARCEGHNPAGARCKHSASAGEVLCHQHSIASVKHISCTVCEGGEDAADMVSPAGLTDTLRSQFARLANFPPGRCALTSVCNIVGVAGAV